MWTHQLFNKNKYKFQPKNQIFIHLVCAFFLVPPNRFEIGNSNSLGIPTVFLLLLCLNVRKNHAATDDRYWVRVDFIFRIPAYTKSKPSACERVACVAKKRFNKRDILTFMISLRKFFIKMRVFLHVLLRLTQPNYSNQRLKSNQR